ncbi:MAG: hypothetical protein Q8N55_00700 [bacterium]|nr:hypothetical protein [bacterium]
MAEEKRIEKLMSDLKEEAAKEELASWEKSIDLFSRDFFWQLLENEEYKGIFKKFAITCLYWPGEVRGFPSWLSWGGASGGWNQYYDDAVEVKQLEAGLLSFLLEAIQVFKEAIEQQPKPERLDYGHSVYFYNLTILQLLSLDGLDEKLAEKAFSLYSFEGPKGDYNFLSMWGFSNYRSISPFELFLLFKVPKSWKKRADEKMQGLITASHHGALSCCREVIVQYFRGYSFHYGLEFFVEQVTFLIDLNADLSASLLGETLSSLSVSEYHENLKCLLFVLEEKEMLSSALGWCHSFVLLKIKSVLGESIGADLKNTLEEALSGALNREEKKNKEEKDRRNKEEQILNLLKG